MQAVVLSGGPTHDFPATTACLSGVLQEAGVDVEVHTGVEEAFGALPGATLLVVNALHATLTSPDVPERLRCSGSARGTGPAERDALAAHLAGGGGVLAVHTATLCFDDWPGWAEAVGASWVWGRSHHPPLGPEIDVRVHRPHPLTDGVDGFRVVDEVYSDLWRAPDVAALLTAQDQPLLWAREHGGGRVVHDALGHHPPSYDVPEHREILRRAVRWTAGS